MTDMAADSCSGGKRGGDFDIPGSGFAGTRIGGKNEHTGGAAGELELASAGGLLERTTDIEATGPGGSDGSG